MNTGPDHVWARTGRALLGYGERFRFDPGTGPGRYGRALTALRESGHETALASFTFDPSEDGSVVVVPAESVWAEDPVPDHTDMPPGRIVSDGTTAWEDGIKRALASVDAGEMMKVVLARQLAVEFEAPVPLLAVVNRLRASQPHSYTFLIDGLVGASPELLVRLSAGRINSLALAGTAVAAEGLSTAKMKREHALTAASVAEGLAGHVHSAQEEVAVLEFGGLHHLATEFAGSAAAGTTVMDVLATLHPTAAVAGTPRESAVELIRIMEPQPRGRYAGPVGWFNTAGEGEFALALRCGLIRGAHATLYSGAGIVPGSDPASELAETELKLRPMLAALGLE